MKCSHVSIALLATTLSFFLHRVAFYSSPLPEFLGRMFVVQSRPEPRWDLRTCSITHTRDFCVEQNKKKLQVLYDEKKLQTLTGCYITETSDFCVEQNDILLQGHEEKELLHEDFMRILRADREQWERIEVVGLLAMCIAYILPLLLLGWWLFVVVGRSDYMESTMTDLLYVLIFPIENFEEQYFREKYNIDEEDEDDGSEVNSGSNENDDK